MAYYLLKTLIMKRLFGHIRSVSLAILLIVASVSCNKSDPHSDNAFWNRLGRKNDFVSTLERILGKTRTPKPSQSD